MKAKNRKNKKKIKTVKTIQWMMISAHIQNLIVISVQSNISNTTVRTEINNFKEYPKRSHL